MNQWTGEGVSTSHESRCSLLVEKAKFQHEKTTDGKGRTRCIYGTDAKRPGKMREWGEVHVFVAARDEVPGFT